MVDSIYYDSGCFEDGEVIHVSGKVDPLDDIEIINLELNLLHSMKEVFHF